MARRTGVPTLLKLSDKLCRLLAKYTSVIVLLYPDNGPLQAALSAAIVACQTLSQELAKVREYGD